MAFISASVQSAPRPTMRYSTPSHAFRSSRSELHMLTWWHWKHFLVRISLPGGSAAGFAGVATWAGPACALATHTEAHKSNAAARVNMRHSLHSGAKNPNSQFPAHKPGLLGVGRW